ncbi:MAG: methyltransferase [Bacteroidota bacterium]
MIFRFKQFSVKHEKSAMKVGTDGNLIGAWTEVEEARKALDIGTGCGLLALMLAQKKSELFIDAIDIDKAAIEEATENVENSPFNQQINVIESRFEDWSSSNKYDLIISNPPFYHQQYDAKGESRILARQGLIDWKDWLPKISEHLSSAGRFSCIFPIDQLEEVLLRAEKSGLFPLRITHIKPKSHLPPHRIALSLSTSDEEVQKDQLIIEKKERHSYTPEYKALLKDYLIIF